MRLWWRSSAVAVDTLSWLTSSLVTIWVPIGVGLYGVVAITAGGQIGASSVLQWVALVTMVGAGMVVHLGSRPHRGPLGVALAALVLILTSAGVLLSAVGLRDAAVVPELWWASLGAALIAMSLSPFVSGRVFVIGALWLSACTVVGAFWATGGPEVELPIMSALVASSSMMFAIIGGSVLTGVVIIDVERWRRLLGTVQGEDSREEPVLSILERVTGGAWSQRMQPFLETMSTAHEITERDRRRAIALADELRSELIDRYAETWLSSITAQWPVHVDDPHQVANTITVDQRSAITALIEGLFSDPEAGVFGARVSLAPTGDDAVAVAVTVSLDLPEGRRTTVLAPYYLSVKSVVRHIRWRNGESLEVSFDVDAEAAR